MSLEELTLGVFTACNTLRIVAYIPQIRKAAIDENGASAISYTTWVLFFFAHISTVAYAIVNRSDWGLAALFAANALCCFAIVAIAYGKRRRRKVPARPGTVPFTMIVTGWTAAIRGTQSHLWPALGAGVMTSTRSPLPLRWLIILSLVAAVIASTATYGAPNASTPRAPMPDCAGHDLRAFSSIEERGETEAAPTAWLTNATFNLLKARKLCHAGDQEKAITLYRRIIDGDMSLSHDDAAK